MVSVPCTCFCLVYTCILVTVFILLSTVESVRCWFRSCCFLNVCYSVLYSCIVWLLFLLSVFVPVFCRRNYVHWLLILLYIIIGQYSCLSIHLLLCSSFIGVDFVLCVAIFWFIPVSCKVISIGTQSYLMFCMCVWFIISSLSTCCMFLYVYNVDIIVDVKRIHAHCMCKNFSSSPSVFVACLFFLNI